MNNCILYRLLESKKIEELQSSISPKNIPLWYYWEEFVEIYSSANKSTQTIENVRDALRMFLKHSSLITLESWNNTIAVEREISRLQQERSWSNGTRWTYIKNLNTYFLYLERKRHITDNPIKRLERVAIETNEQYTIPLDKAKAVLGHINMRKDTEFGRLRNSLFFHILYITGARPIELLNLNSESLNAQRTIITIQGAKQKGKPRYYEIPSYIQKLLTAYFQKIATLQRQENLLKHLFVSSSKKCGWTMKGVNKLCQRLSKELGFKVNCYAFRRMVATEMYKGGCDLKDIQQHLGHTRATTTLRYVEKSACLTKVGTNFMGNLMKN